MNFTEILEKETGYITEENFYPLVQKTLNEFKALGFNVSTKVSDYSLAFNNRALKCLGRCELKKGGKYIIQINEFHNKLSPEWAVMNTLIHELLHSLPNGMNHKKNGGWKNYVDKYNMVYGTTISRTSALKGDYKLFVEEKEKRKKSNTKIPKYYLICNKCKHKFPYEKKCKMINLTLAGKKLICPTCGKQYFTFKQNY